MQTQTPIASSNRVPITQRALVARLKRRHARDHESFHVTRSRWQSNLGYWHTVDDRNVIAGWWNNLEDLEEHARDLGVLKPYEMVQL